MVGLGTKNLSSHRPTAQPRLRAVIKYLNLSLRKQKKKLPNTKLFPL